MNRHGEEDNGEVETEQERIAEGMKIGISGLPGCGKTTLFNALTGLRADTGPGQRQRENSGMIKVPDARLEALVALHHSRRKVPAEVGFVDTAAPPGEEVKGGGLHPQVMQAFQGLDALVVVLRAFENPLLNESAATPAAELRNFLAELILSDLGPLETRLKRLQKEKKKESERELLLIERCIASLEAEKPLLDAKLSEQERQQLASFGCLTLKPLLIVINQSEAQQGAALPAALLQALEERQHMALCGQLEMEIAQLPPAEQPAYMEALEITHSARERFVQQACGLLELIHFFTSGPEESRAWPLRKGLPARRAAGRIHSDIERGFIRAEVIACEELLRLGGEKQARDAGRLRLEGKEYIVQDGDVINFRFNV